MVTKDVFLPPSIAYASVRSIHFLWRKLVKNKCYGIVGETIVRAEKVQ